jgi:glycosyltransferase involved in cell wall biosynthesis
MHTLLTSHRFRHADAGGTEILVHDLAAALLARGIEVSWMAPGPLPPHAAMLPGCAYLPLPVATTSEYPAGWHRHERQLVAPAQRLLRSRPPVDVVHVLHFARTGLEFLRCLALSETPAVATLTDYTAVCPDHQLMKRHSDQLCHALAPSQECLTCLQLPGDALGEVDEWRSRNRTWLNETVAAYWVQTPHQAAQFAAAGISTRHLVRDCARYGLPAEWAPLSDGAGGSDYLLFLGRCSPEKGLHLLLDAYRRSSTRMPLVLATVPDDPGYESWLRALAAQDTRIRWQPPTRREHIGPLLAGARALLIPSLWLENHPIVAHEALALGTPVCCSAVASMKHLAHVPGLHLVEDFSQATAWGAVIDQLSHTPTQRPRPTFAALLLAFEDFVDETVGVYTKVAAPR